MVVEDVQLTSYRSSMGLPLNPPNRLASSMSVSVSVTAIHRPWRLRSRHFNDLLSCLNIDTLMNWDVANNFTEDMLLIY